MELSAASSACADGCCGATPRRTASELFERGFRRNRMPPLAVQGPAVTNADGLTARFSLRLVQGVLEYVRFRASTCATLIAYCELLAELAAKRGPAEAGLITAQFLAAELPDVHAMKRD